MSHKIVKLENWSVVINRVGIFCNTIHILNIDNPSLLSGIVYGHPRFSDGDSVYPTKVFMTNGKNIITKNTQYILGTVDPEYDQWMQKNHPEKWDPENPIFGE